MEPIYVTRSSMPDFDEYCREIRKLWDSRVLTNSGEIYRELQQGLREYLGVPNVTMYCNGHLALEAALEALELQGEVITTPFTFASTTNAIVRRGLTPVFCDVKEGDFTIDPEKIEALITERTVAILPVHVYGRICDDAAISSIAKKHHLRVIYDAAHAFGETVNGRGVGTLGDASMFSFHATKVFHTIEGGALTYADAALSPKLDSYRDFGITSPESVEYVGGNYKMNEFAAAMGVCNLRHVDEEIAKRKAVYDRYLERLDGIPGILIPPAQKNVRPNYAYFPVVFDGYRETRDAVLARLKEDRVFGRKYFYPLTSDFGCYRGRSGFGGDRTPVAKRASERVATLPFFADMTREQVDRVCDLLIGK